MHSGYSARWGIAYLQMSTSLLEEKIPKPIDYADLVRMVEQARDPPTQSRKLHKASAFEYRSSLRGWTQVVANNARYRDRIKGRQSELDYGHVLDLVLEQHGRCAYSGVAMELLQPHSHWRASIERMDNSLGYVRGNCCLIAAEFNSAVRSTSSGGADSCGSAQWSRSKVLAVGSVRAVPADLTQLLASVDSAQLRPATCRTRRVEGFRGPDAEGRWRCGCCGTWKQHTEFYRRTQSSHGLQFSCRLCTRRSKLLYLQTMRGHGLALVQAARQRAAKHNWVGTFSLQLCDLLDMLWIQGGRCYYSGIPLRCAAGPADWVWSIERLDNGVTYTRENCVLIAQEFNTSDQSRNKTDKQVFGTAQWSRNKAERIWGPYCHLV